MSESANRLAHSAATSTYRLFRRNAFLLAAMVIAVLAAWPLLSEPGLLNSSRGGGDSPFLLQRVHQLETALLDGQFPVRWMPDANYGYGYPFFNYYAPLSIYIAVLFRLIGFSFVQSIRLAQLLGFLVAAVAMFALGRRWLASRWAGLLASAAYSLAPFHLVNVYVRGDSLAEFWAMAFYPMVILTADDLIRAAREHKNRKVKVALFAGTYAGLILTHNISALIFTPFLLLYLGIGWWRMRSNDEGQDIRLTSTSSTGFRFWSTRLLPLVLGVVLALSLAAFFFLPALGESSLAQLDPALAGHFYYGNHFRGTDLIQSSWLFDYDPKESSAFRVGLVQAIATVAGILVFIGVRRTGAITGSPRNAAAQFGGGRSVRYVFVLLTLIITTLMITPISRKLWEWFPLLPFTQFPWRFLSVQAIATALATAGLALLRPKRVIVPVAILLLLVSSLDRLETAHLVLTDADVTAQKLAQYEWFTGNIGSTVSGEYLPATAQPRAYTSAWITTGERESLMLVGGQLVEEQKMNSRVSRQTWEVEIAPTDGMSEATLTFPTLYWPGWRGEVDGERSEIYPAPGSGLITLDIQPGRHTIELRLGPTPIRAAADLISALAFLVAIWLLKSIISRRVLKVGFTVLLLLTPLIVGLHLWPDPKLPPDDLTWDFAQMGYLHHSPEGISFDTGAVLQHYVLSQDEINAGEDLDVTLTWSEAEVTPTTQVTVTLASPAVNRFDAAPILVSRVQPLKSGRTTYRLPIPDTAPPGLYVPRVTLSQGWALMSANRPRGDLFLRPIRVIPLGRPAEPEGPDLDVRVEQAIQRDETTLELHLQLLTRRQLNQNYNISLRLVDALGAPLVQFDSQPGYGFLPSSGWPPGEWVNDRLAMSLNSVTSVNFPYLMTARLYEVSTGDLELVRYLGELHRQDEGLVFYPPEPVFTLPETYVTLAALFQAESEPIIQLHGYEIEQTTERIELTLYWGALAAGEADYTRFVHLIDPTTERPPLAQSDQMPRYNSYPTSQWSTGEVVADTVSLDLSAVSPGEYQLVVGLYRNLGDSFPRLTAVDEAGTQFPFDRVPLPFTVVVDGQ